MWQTKMKQAKKCTLSWWWTHSTWWWWWFLNLSFIMRVRNDCRLSFPRLTIIQLNILPTFDRQIICFFFQITCISLRSTTSKLFSGLFQILTRIFASLRKQNYSLLATLSVNYDDIIYEPILTFEYNRNLLLYHF